MSGDESAAQGFFRCLSPCGDQRLDVVDRDVGKKTDLARGIARRLALTPLKAGFQDQTGHLW
jgi:hypothetical protein